MANAALSGTSGARVERGHARRGGLLPGGKLGPTQIVDLLRLGIMVMAKGLQSECVLSVHHQPPGCDALFVRMSEEFAKQGLRTGGRAQL